MKSCILFCDCGSIGNDGKWKSLELPLSSFLAGFIMRRVDVIEFRRVTCPNCVKIAEKTA